MRMILHFSQQPVNVLHAILRGASARQVEHSWFKNKSSTFQEKMLSDIFKHFFNHLTKQVASWGGK